MIRYYLWDFDGTLFDTYTVMAKAFQDALHDFGHDADIEDIYAKMKVSMDVVIDFYSKEFRLENSFVERYLTILSDKIDEIRAFPDVEETLAAIVKNGGKNFIVTHRGRSTNDVIDHLHLSQYFVEYVTSENGFARKPSPDAINYLLEKYSMKPEETIMVGDRALDILAGKNAGCMTAYFRGNSYVEDVEADIDVSSFKDFMSIMGLLV
jgi:HAD superfamily hydrolase (TIGR01549 family)